MSSLGHGGSYVRFLLWLVVLFEEGLFAADDAAGGHCEVGVRLRLLG